MEIQVPGMKQHLDAEGVLILHFDSPGERVNLLNAELLRGLDALLDAARADRSVHAVMFGSAKPGMFVAGMNVAEIAGVTDAATAAEGARLGQSVFQKIEDLGKPSLCAINGTCLGGGTELALACTFRIAADDAGPIGLPEVKLGIIPGFGGSQRLPRVVGLTAALDMILTGRNLDARRAKKIGLVDRLVPAAYLSREGLALLKEARGEGPEAVARRLRRPRVWHQRALEGIGPLRRLVIDQARRKTAEKADPTHYPAPFRALDAIDAAFTQPLSTGLDTEARIVGELVPTTTSKNLCWLFGAQTELKSSAVRAAAPRPIRRIGVLGAGIMGGGIAQLAADKGIPVRLRDLRYDAVLTALKTAHSVWDYKVKRRRMTEAERGAKMAFIAPTLDTSGFGQVDLIVEAVVEQLAVKRKVLAEIEPRIGARTVFATNTSSLPIGEIASGAVHPERVVGMHFFNPVHRMPLVEVIAGPRTSPEAVATVHSLAVRMGKVPVIVQDGPGFLVNRILTLYLNEAMQLLLEGVRIDAIDRAMLAFGMPMGPFALLDQVGLDTARHVGGVMVEAFGERIGGSGSMLDTMIGDGEPGSEERPGFLPLSRRKAQTSRQRIYQLIGDRRPRGRFHRRRSRSAWFWRC